MTTFIPHTWGPLYETLKEMEKNGDEHKDEKLKYAFELFNKLDNAKSLLQIRNFVKHGLKKIPPTEQKRLCSPCFDGIVETIHSSIPIELLIHKYSNSPHYIETFKYYLPKIPLSESRRNELTYYFRENKRLDYETVFSSYFSLIIHSPFYSSNSKVMKKIKDLLPKNKDEDIEFFIGGFRLPKKQR